jgi:hypothetical protein
VERIRVIRELLAGPFRDLPLAMERVLPRRPWGGLLAMLAGLLGGWWLYVPLHELLHALGCVAAGGEVHRLELQRRYGASLLHEIFPFVTAGSDFAGRLAAFDTRGSDLAYAVTVWAPYALTVIVGVPALRHLARPAPASAGRCLALGAVLPVAYAPFIGLAGDFYELASIAVSRAAVSLGAPAAMRWRTDDPWDLVQRLRAEGVLTAADGVGMALGLALGTLAAFATYRLGGAVAAGLTAWRRPSRGAAPGRP